MDPSLAFAALAGVLGAAGTPVELGVVEWSRGLVEAQAKAVQLGRPVLILFDEIPGCSTVQGFGRDVLGHPLVADAIQHAFVPVLVQNNTDGPDRAVLDSFGEPAWNNPVIRILGDGGKELTPRFAGPYTVAATARLLASALLAAGRTVPGYLAILVEEETVRPREATALYSMYCFWEGEARVGGWSGVVRTQPGFSGGHEVVRISYDPRRLTAAQLAALAQGAGYKPQQQTFEPSTKDEKYQLQGTNYRFIPLTPMQRMRLNAHVDPDAVLSPTQKQWLKRVEAQPRAARVDLLWEDNIMVAMGRFGR